MEKGWLHFIGIKGVGMSALAIVAKGLGYKVTGSDVPEEFITDSSLKDAEITSIPFKADNISPQINYVILGAAYGADHPEVAATKNLHLKTLTYSELMGLLANEKKLLAIAGTHGKTTTSSLVSYLLFKAGMDPTWVIGTGHVTGLPSHGHAGNGEYFVAEVDEYKRAANDLTPKFLDVKPYGAILTSIEHDHPDVYATIHDVISAFEKFIRQIPDHGFIVANADDQRVRELMDLFPQKQWITYGFGTSAEYRIIGQDAAFRLNHHESTTRPYTLQLKGKHNLYNAAAAVIMCEHIGLSSEKLQTILPTFQSVERRFEIIGEKDGITVIDDYAHHPTAVATTLEGAKEAYPNKKIYCFFQPHTFSRTEALMHEFAQSFTAADEVIITDIFGSAREGSGNITAMDLVDETKKYHQHVQYVPSFELLKFLEIKVTGPAVVITMGAGDIYKIGKQYLGIE